MGVINVGTIENQETIIEKLGKTADTGGSDTAGTAMAKLNEVLKDTAEVLSLISFGMFEEETPGTYSVQLPPTITEITVTACGAGGGGGGGGANNASTYNGAGGGGGAAIKDKKFTVPQGTILTVTIGEGGKNSPYTTDGTAGGATIIEGLVTLAGGSGGKHGSSPTTVYEGGAAGGTGGGKGGNSGQNGENGIVGTGGITAGGAGGGGGSIGNGGNAVVNGGGRSGTRGGGGGGGNYRYGGSGGNGYVRIVW